MALGGMELGIIFALCCSCILVLGLGGAGIWFFTRDRNKSTGQGVIDVAARPAPAPAARSPQPPPAASARPAPPPAAESAPTVVYSRKDVEQAKAENAKPAPAADPQATMLHIPRVKVDEPKPEAPAAELPSSATMRDFKPATDPGATMLHLPSIGEDQPAASEAAEPAGESLAAAVSELERQAEAVVETGSAAAKTVEDKASAAEAVVESADAPGEASQAAETIETQAEQAQAASGEVAASAGAAGDDFRTVLHMPAPPPPAPSEPPAVPDDVDPLKSELSEAPTLRWPRNDEPTNTVSTASPNRAPDIREKLLALNGPDKPYIVQESGFRITIAPTAITGYLLEISFDYITGTARLVETGPSDGGRIKADARQVLETNGWLAK
jgi:hypothetical protein